VIVLIEFADCAPDDPLPSMPVGLIASAGRRMNPIRRSSEISEPLIILAYISGKVRSKRGSNRVRIDSGNVKMSVDQGCLHFRHFTVSTVSLLTDRRASS
jgi:hypothetical protein